MLVGSRITSAHSTTRQAWEYIVIFLDLYRRFSIAGTDFVCSGELIRAQAWRGAYEELHPKGDKTGSDWMDCLFLLKGNHNITVAGMPLGS